MDDEIKGRPKIGDRVEFRAYNITRIGTVVAIVAETGAHFRIKMPPGFRYKYRKIGINNIIKILPEVN